MIVRHPDDSQSERFTQRIVLALGIAALTGGSISLIGWLVGIDWFKDWARTGIAIKANTALAISISGLALITVSLTHKLNVVIIAAGLSVALIGSLTLSEHLFGWDLGIDELLATEAPGARATIAPGRMGPPASLSFVLVGASLVLLTGGPAQRRFVPFLGIVGLAISLLSITGYLYGAEFMYAAPRVTGIAGQSALMFLWISLALFAAVPELQPMKMLLDQGAAGLTARRLLPAIFLLPLLVGWLRLVGQNLNLYDTAFGAALRTLVEIALFAGFGWWIVLRIRDYEAASQDAERRKDEFLALLAHELRNPLAPVMNSLALLDLQRQGNPALGEPVVLMRRQMTHMVRLVDDLLDVSRISRGKFELRRQPTDLIHVVRQSLEMVQPLAQQFGHVVDSHLPAGPFVVDADGSRLTQAISNVLNNACRYTPRGGRITLDVSREGDGALVLVKDSGIGIPVSKLESIFEMFTQLDSSLERETGGLGIGLHLVRHLVDLHGGSVTAHSDGPGHGSQFEIRLPLAVNQQLPAEVPEARTPATASEQVSATKPRILVVDDNRDSAVTLALLLRKRGNDVQTAHDGEEAVARAASFQPEIILLDIGLPKLNGYDACRAIRASSSEQIPLIVALTGWGQEEDRKRAELAGFDAHLTKPVDHALLMSTLAKLQKPVSPPVG